MTGRHYNWHTRWTVDVEAASATHESGLVARFLLLPLSESQVQASETAGDTAIGKCWTPDGREWGVVAAAGNVRAVYDAMEAKNGPHNAPQMMARLAREAGELWAKHRTMDH